MEAELFDTCDNLSELGVGELTGDRRGYNCVDLIVSRAVFVLALFEDIDRVKDEGFIGDSTERALIYARAALDTFAVIDRCGFSFAHGDRFYLASVLAGALAVYDRGIGTYLRASAALLTLRFIDMCNVVLVEP